MDSLQDSSEIEVLERNKIEFQLLRIIVIDSYCRGKKVELKLDGHVSLNGANGAGKTTLLRLIPIFFGERPQRVIFGKDPFATYYFPTTSSYIVYEYQRRDTKVLAVIHADGQGQTASYRFIDSPYEDRLFRTDSGFVQSQDLHKHLQLLEISETKPLSRTHYEQILVNNATSQEHRKLAARYSFVGSGSRLSHISRVISGILNRVTEFSDLKRMVVSTILGEDKQFTLSTKRNELMKWIRELQAHQSLEEKRVQMISLEEADAKRIELIASITTVHSRFYALVNHLTSNRERISNELDNKKSTRNIAENLYRSNNNEAADVLATLKASVRQKSDEIETIQSRFNKYLANGIKNDCTLVDSLANMQSDQSKLAILINELSGEIKNVDDKFQKLKSDEALAFEKQKGAELQIRGDITEKASLERANARTSHQIMIDQLKEASNVIIDALNIQEKSANDTVISLKSKLPLIVGDSAIQESLKTEQNNLTSINNLLEAANQELLSNANKYNQIQRKFDDQERLCSDVSLVLEDADIKYNQLQEFSNAGKDTLIGFLRTERPEWVSDIGRIINEEVLLRKDLEPELDEGNSLYGININLERIKDSKLSNEEKIQQELTYAQNKIKKAQDACNEEDQNLSQISKDLSAANDARKLSEANLSQLSNALIEAKNKVSLWTTKLNYSKESAIEKAQAELEVATNQLKDINSNITIEIKKIKAAIEEKNKALSTILTQLDTNEKESLADLTKRDAELYEDFQLKIKAIEDNRIEVLAGKGVDPEYLKKLESELTVTNDKIKEANEKVTNVHNYRIWLEDTYSTIDSRKLEVNKLHIDLDSATNSQLQLKKEYEINDAIFSNAITELEASLSVEDKGIRTANNQLEFLSSWPRNQLIESTTHDGAYSLHDLISTKTSLLNEYAAHNEIISKGVTSIRQIMLRMPGTATEQYCLSVEKEAGMPVLHREYEWLRVCRNWFNDGYKVNQDYILSEGRTQGLSIRTFCGELEDMRTKVLTFNREIRNSLGQAKMFAKINSVDINISTDIDKQDYWQAINELREQYDNWQPLASNSMPPKSFVEAANEVSKKVNDERGLIANPTDLINIRIDARINDKDLSAKEEKELKEMSSNGLSYLVLAIVMVGFVNRIRGKNKIAIPYAVDEVKDLDHVNSVSLLDFLANNNIMLIGAFPDVDERLSPHFKYKYSVLDDKQIATIEIPETSDFIEAN